jgi:hypothetical protein
MSDAIAYTPAAKRNSEAAEAKADTAPLKAFESALLNVKASAPVQADTPAATPAAVPTAQVRGERSSRPGTGKDLSPGKDNAPEKAARTDDAGPRPASGSAATVIASGVQASTDTEAAAKSAAKAAKKSSAPAKPSAPDERERSGAVVPADIAPPYGDQLDTAVADGMAPTAALSNALSNGSADAIKAALQTTLEGFANGSVPDAIKASLSKAGTAPSAEITGLLDNISMIAQDLLAKGPLGDLDFATSIDELFWVSNWFDLFNQPSSYDPMTSINYSVSSAMALPMDILYTRALLVPLIDVERVVTPGLASRRAVRANMAPVPGASDLNNDS